MKPDETSLTDKSIYGDQTMEIFTFMLSSMSNQFEQEIYANNRNFKQLCMYQTKVSISILCLFLDAQANHLWNTYLKLIVIYHMHVVK